MKLFIYKKILIFSKILSTSQMIYFGFIAYQQPL